MMIFFGILTVFSFLVAIITLDNTNANAAKWVFATSALAMVILKVAEYLGV